MPPCYNKIKKKILITLLKPLSFLPALLMMYIIFSFSAQTGEVSGNLSYRISYQIIKTKNRTSCRKKAMKSLHTRRADSLLHRKAAHDRILSLCRCCFFSIYIASEDCGILLAGSSAWALRAGRISSVLCGRPFSQDQDVEFDSLGALVRILLVQLFCWGPPSTRLLPETKSAVKGGKTRKPETWIFMFPRPVLHILISPGAIPDLRPYLSSSSVSEFCASCAPLSPLHFPSFARSAMVILLGS